MKIYKHIIFTSFLFFVFSISLNAQSISGIINDSEGLPLPGATIQNLNTLDGVSTDFDGKFNIDASLDDVLSYGETTGSSPYLLVGSTTSNKKWSCILE